MTKLKFFKGSIDIREIIKKTAVSTSLLFGLATVFFFLKDRYAINKKLLIAQPIKVCFVNTSQPFAMMSMNFNCRYVKPVVERFQENVSTTAEGGEVMAKHSKEVLRFVAAKGHLNHVHKNVRPLYIYRDDQVIQTTKSRAFPSAVFQGQKSYSLESFKWQGPIFKFELSTSVDNTVEKKQVVQVRATETASYAFLTRNRIQRGDGNDDPFLPTNQLGRDILGDQTKQLEHRISEAFSVDAEDENRDNVVQTGNENIGEIELETSESVDLEETQETTAYGLAEMFANAHNTSIFNQLTQSPHFDRAARLLHDDLALDLSNYGNARNSGQTNVQNVFADFPGLFHDTQNQQLTVYVEEPHILNRLSRYVKTLEVAEQISEPGYTVTFTGDKNQKHFSTFAQAGVYNRQRALRQTINTNLAGLNANPLSYVEALSVEDVLEKVPNPADRIEVFTNVMFDVYEAPDQWDETLNNLLQPKEKQLEALTYDSAIDADHFLRKELRIGLGQRLLNTNPADDKSMSVELPVSLHRLKEQFTNFKEPENFTYANGLTEFLTEILKSIHQGFDQCTPSQLHHIPVEMYKKAYTECYNAKIQEMNERYEGISERERLMIYHAQIIRNCDQQDLESFIENHTGTSTIEKTTLGEQFKTNRNLAADPLRKNSEQRSGFIKTLSEFCSEECAAIINLIQQQHECIVKANFLQIEAITHPLSETEKADLFNPPSLTEKLFQGDSNIELLTKNQRDEVLYNHAAFIGLTNIGNGFPSPGPILNYQTQERYIETGAEDKTKKRVEGNNTHLTVLMDSQVLIGHSGQEVKNPADAFSDFLIENNLPGTLVEILCENLKITTFEELCEAVKNGTIADYKGIGPKKQAKIQEVIDQHTQLVENVLTTTDIEPGTTDIEPGTTDIEPGTSNTVVIQGARKGSVRSITASTSSTASRALSKPITQNQSNLLESSTGVKLLEGGLSSSK